MDTRLYEQYNDSVRIVWRDGTEHSPYIDVMQPHKIINNKIVLEEIPVEFHRVVIHGFSEIDQRKPSAKKVPDIQDFIVNYSNGVVVFHPSQEGKTVVAKYKGRGFIQYPASRIWAYYPNPDVVMDLQEIIESSYKKIEEVTIAIEHAVLATNDATIAAEGAIIATGKANQATDAAISAANTAIDASKRADESAILAKDAVLSTRLIWLDPVPTYADIATTYPTPETGSTTMVLGTGARYRYEGNGIWRQIDNYTRGSIPLASTIVDGLMSKEDYRLMHTKLQYKTVVFVLPALSSLGVQKPIISVPFDGKIKEIKAICNKPCNTASTELYITKIAKDKFGTQSNWERITASPISFGISENVGFVPPTVLTDVAQGDVFRIEMEKFDPVQEGITVSIDIEL